MSFRIIPQLDKNERIIQWTQTFWGKLAWFPIYSFGLYLGVDNYWSPIAIAILFLSILGRPNVRWIALVNLTVLIATGGLLYFKPKYGPINLLLPQGIGVNFEASNFNIYEAFFHWESLISIFAFLLLFYLFYILSLRSKIFQKFYLTIIFSIFVLMTYASIYGGLSGWLSSCLVLLLICLSKGFWYFCYVIEDRRHIKTKNIFYQILTFAPYWSLGSTPTNPIPRGLLEIESKLGRTQRNFAIIQLKGVKLLYWSVFIKLSIQLLTYFLYGYSCDYCVSQNWPYWGLTNYNYWGFEKYNSMNLSVLNGWFGILYFPLYTIFYELIGTIGVIIAIVRLNGIYAFREVHKPYLATNFGEFFRSIYFYYNEVLIKFFFFPFWRLSLPLRSHKKLRKFLCTFATIAVGGSIIHFMRKLDFITIEKNIFEMTLNRFPYFLALGLVSAISAIRNKKTPVTAPVAIRISKFLLVYFTYAVVFSLGAGYHNSSFYERARFFLSLIGLKSLI